MEMHSNVKRTQIRDSELNIITLIYLELGSWKLKVRVNNRSNIPRNASVLPSQNKREKDCRSFDPISQAQTQQQESSDCELHVHI
jgi:hypothetical protein